MIHYQLRCTADHRFDGWFRDSAGFDQQAQAGLVSCPECGSPEIRRALMAPSLGRNRSAKTIDAAPEPGPPTQPPVEPPQIATPQPAANVAGAQLPDKVRAVLQRLRAEVESRCENVGPRFAEEARAIHNGETPARPIYGDTTPEQAEALADDGIEVARIPWLPRADG